MLFFLDYAAQERYIVDSYEDQATGTMGRNESGGEYVETIVLSPLVLFSGPLQPSPAQIAALHERAHRDCYIANSVKTKITAVPRLRSG